MINSVNDAVYYAVIAENTTHVANTQQMCNITLCWADAQLNAHEHLTVRSMMCRQAVCQRSCCTCWRRHSKATSSGLRRMQCNGLAWFRRSTQKVQSKGTAKNGQSSNNSHRCLICGEFYVNSRAGGRWIRCQ